MMELISSYLWVLCFCLAVWFTIAKALEMVFT